MPLLKSCLKTEGARSPRKKVWFDQIQVREHAIILGDNPSTTEGIPITIDWDYQKETLLDVEYFELYRPERRRYKNKLRLAPQRRAQLYVLR